ncbi:uncharacterized protein B0H64DRAFT_353273 [Chaetomium fimeti]|uniref:Peroxin/Ferlin domain-containing protein n=1 Tax=Chaetomium fimeti TaxID=1854472 RepID=A0AAE0HRM5_9PEZI|nr:hypothetical protein B0H64DRAFT_353273 [Chaetomium fimeti]
MPKIRHHRSSRRAPPPKDSDFDHEINLVDRDEEESPLRSSLGGPSTQGETTATATESQVDDGEDGISGEVTGREDAGQPSVVVEGPTPQVELGDPVSKIQTTKHHAKPKTPESAVDILYENQRGGFLCGMPLFSSMALGNLDPPAWTNFAHRPSPTNINTAQVPDPSWEWAWPEWRINHDEGVDEDGWEYSFAFSKKFAWHKARWWNSFVRRRAWIRKRVRKDAGYLAQGPHMLNPEYFTIRPSSETARDGSPSRASSVRGSRVSMSTVNLEGVEPPVIEHADGLLHVLRVSRIDREKIEAVDNYLENSQENLEGLQSIMHDIMALFVFQASRRVLLSKLTDIYDMTLAEHKKEKDPSPDLDQRVKNLAAAVTHADEEVKRLEYWSDAKDIAEEGGSKGAVDQEQGWDSTWRGVDRSGPSGPPAPKDETKKGGVNNLHEDGA